MPEPLAPPPMPGVAPAPVGIVAHPNPPRAGDLSIGWRAATATTWLVVILAMAAVWNASVQIGISTWWLGPRSDPQPRIVQFAPFVAPALMLLAAVNQIRWIPWLGLGASATIVAVAAGDLGRIDTLAIVEFVIAGAAAAVSLASLSGQYRHADSTTDTNTNTSTNTSDGNDR